MKVLNYIALIVISFILHGCASQQAMSSYARTGDTVMVSLGGDYINALVPVVKKQNMSVSIVDSTGTSYPVSVRYLFQSNSNLMSKYSLRSLVQGSYDYGQGAYQGLWMAVVDLEDPTTGAKPPLVPGAGTLSFTTSDINTSSGGSYGNISSIEIEILSGAGNKNPLNSYNAFGNIGNPVESLEPAEQIRLTPVNLSGNSNIGGARLTIRYTDNNFTSAHKPRLVPVSQDPNIQLITSTQPQADGTTLIEAIVMNIHGVKQTNSHHDLAKGISDFRALELALVWTGVDTVDDADWQAAIQLNNAEFIDVNGDVIPNASYSLAKVN
ncbi:MAG: hypothetical protein QM500_03230 [Methylococcales bacterium]